MGLGGQALEWDDYEWVDLSADLPPVGDGLAEALGSWFEEHPLWAHDPTPRVLLVDLDNLRAEPRRWRARMTAVVTLARQAEHAFMAGQRGAVRRARPHLAEYADQAQAIADGSDVADLALLDSVAGLSEREMQVVVVSNDGIFAALADRGPLVVLSPGVHALSDRLWEAAERVVDLAALERGEPGAGLGATSGDPGVVATRPGAMAGRSATRRAPARKSSATKQPATKTASKKTTTTKSASKQTASKQTASKTSASKTSASKKSASKKSASKQTANKTSANKTSASKQTANKTSATKTSATKKTAAENSAKGQTATDQSAQRRAKAGGRGRGGERA
ncbi:MAG: hypothetical protein QOE01_1849 [Actinomycetota bacterium]|jgi:hypothetical protein|nr:hypothetical protein [Actinomycetota bacterium]